MFQGATSFNGDISKWDVSRVGDMKNMFRNAESFKHSLCGASWVQSKAIKARMFVGSSGSISRNMCSYKLSSSDDVCVSNLPGYGIPVPHLFGPRFKILSNEHLKREVAEHLERSPTGDCSDCPQRAIGEWDVSRVTDMSDLFNGAHMFNGDISKWDVSRVTNMKRMFASALSFNGDISRWHVSHVTDMTNLFTGARQFKGDISKWDVSSVKYMNGMFEDALAFGDAWHRFDIPQAFGHAHFMHQQLKNFLSIPSPNTEGQAVHNVNLLRNVRDFPDELAFPAEFFERMVVPRPRPCLTQPNACARIVINW